MITEKDKSLVCDGIGNNFRQYSDAAYIAYIETMRNDLCLGWEAKVAANKFDRENLNQFMKAGELLGRHVAMAEAALIADKLQGEIDRLMMEYCPHEMTDTQKACWAKHQIAVPYQAIVVD